MFAFHLFLLSNLATIRLVYLYRSACNEAKAQFQGLAQQARAASDRFSLLKKELAAKKKKAETECPIQDENGRSLPLLDKLESLDVSTTTECDVAIEEVTQMLNSIRANDGVFEQYEKVEKQVKEVEAQLQTLSTSRENKLQLITAKSGPWEAVLRNNIQKIDIKFTHYMEQMGCTGTVRLKKGAAAEADNQGENSNEELPNFKDWGIEILVSYRENAKAQILSAHRHSGGERSVATILYLMALQDLMVAPFRCVDEINQGLDERNERLVFKRIVANSTQPPRSSDPTNHSGQYFLITPKLLPDLTDMENEGVTIQLVCNGKK